MISADPASVDTNVLNQMKFIGCSCFHEQDAADFFTSVQSYLLP